MKQASRLPKIVKILQSFPAERVNDLQIEIRHGVERCLQHHPLAAGARVAITAGSRGIRHIDDILRYVVQAFLEQGFRPFLVSSMGSHGGGSAEGQQAVLESLGISETTMGVPVSCSNEVTELGKTAADFVDKPYRGLCKIEGLPVCIAKEAMEADTVFIVNRIKPHTAFHGDYESGLLKMIAVGLGRATGANRVHSLGANMLADAIPSIASVVLSSAPILGALAIVENAFDEPAIIRGIPAHLIPFEEKELLLKAKSFMPSLPAMKMDLCLIGEMGKNYSGTGMDTNIIGRMRIHTVPEPSSPSIQYIGVLGLSEPSHGNATGIGLADFTTQAVGERIDWPSTYLNCLTSGFTLRASLPMVFSSDLELLEKAMFALKIINPDELKFIYIKNTLALEEVWVSEALLRELDSGTELKTTGEPFTIPFDNDGKLLLPKI